MKVCTSCSRVVLNRVGVCPECDGQDFTVLLVAPYNDIEPYLEEEDEETNETL